VIIVEHTNRFKLTIAAKATAGREQIRVGMLTKQQRMAMTMERTK